MRKLNRSLAFAFTALLLSGSFAAAQAMPPAQAAAPAADPSKAILQFTQRFESNVMALAQAMPADKYSFAPSSDVFKPGSPAKFDTVRTFAQQLTHIAEMSLRFYAPYGVTPPADIDMKNLSNITSKDDVLKVVQAAFDYQNKTIATLTTQNAFTPQGQRGQTLISAIIFNLNDDADHYGQLVEYARMNGIVPPASERPATPAAPQK